MRQAFLYIDCKKASRNFRINYKVGQKSYTKIVDKTPR